MRLFSLLLFAIFLSACATPHETTPSPALNKDDGAMILRALPNMGRVSQFFSNWDTLKVQRVEQAADLPGKIYTIKTHNEGASRSGLFSAALPPGEYRLVEFSSASCAAMCLSDSVRINDKFSRFDIKPARLTDLGLVLMANGAERTVAVVHDSAPDRSETVRLVGEFFPALAGMADSPLLGWKPETVPRSMATAFSNARNVGSGVASPQTEKDGSLVFGSMNGIVVSRMEGAAPLFHDVGVRKAVESLLITSEGSWIAGGELGLLRQSDDRGKTWRTIGDSLPLGLITGVHQWRQSLIVTISRGKTMSVYINVAGSADWKQLARHDGDKPIVTNVGWMPESFLVLDRLITLIPANKIAILDLTTGLTEVRSLPGESKRFTVAQDGMIRCSCVATFAFKLSESHDFGKTWIDSPGYGGYIDPVFRDKLRGVSYKASRAGAGPMAYTEDGGKTWTETTVIDGDVIPRWPLQIPPPLAGSNSPRQDSPIVGQAAGGVQ